MGKAYYRKEFLQLLAVLGTGWILDSCNTGPKPKTNSADKIPATADAAVEQFNSGDAVYIKKGEEQYDKLRAGFNKRIDKYPLVIAVCKNTNGVAEAIRYARINKLKVAVKSGGHSIEGFCVNEGGMVINLSLMNKIEWVRETEVKLQPGCKLSELYDELLPKGRLIPAGSCGSVGVGGLALGGGYGFFSRTYGLTCDSLKEVTLVDGYGKIHSSKDDEELLWACRGGGNGNFGVVTEMVFKTHTAPATLTSYRFKSFKVDMIRARDILKNWFEVTATLPQSCFSAFVLNGKTIMILVTDYAKENAATREALDKFAALADKTTIGSPRPLAAALKVFYGASQPVYFKNACAGMYNGYGTIADCVGEAIEMVLSTPGLIYQVNTFGGAVADEQFSEGSCFAHRSFNYLSELQSYWQQPSQQEKLIKTFDSIQSVFARYGIDKHYCNYPDLRFENPQQAYYGNSYARLQQVKKRLDGDNVICHAQSIQLPA
ncbi:MAG TPA: FAD-binding oxidoreductase [Chitinophagales bacterium]|nr:FAD-binding oxidoreductase [Chitinophagales bacterium]